MKKALLVLTLVATTAHADLERGPTDFYSLDKLMTTQTTITIRPVDNVQAVCEKESRARGFGGFGTPMEACSFWAPNTCTIIVPRRANNDILGHELRHCFVGKFH